VLAVPVLSDKGREVAVGYAQGGTEAVRDQFFLLDPAANTAGTYTEIVANLSHGEEFRRFGFHLFLHCKAACRHCLSVLGPNREEGFVPPRAMVTSADRSECIRY
jgi:hypothetical protein